MHAHQILLSYLLAFIVTLFFTNCLQPIAFNLKLIDIANNRKSHTGKIPLVGGLAMFIGFSLSILSLPVGLDNFRAYFAANIIIVVIGALDDFRELTGASRLLAQILASTIIVFIGNVELTNFGDILFLGELNAGYLSPLITIIAIVGIMNAINMLDGIDGLSGTLAIIIFSFMAYIAYSSYLVVDFHIIMILILCILGFLIYNFPLFKNSVAKIFMGDCGSLFLGLNLVYFLIKTSQVENLVNPVAILWLMIFPLFDTGSVIFSRLMKKISPMTPGRDHIHHLLLSLNFQPRSIVLIASVVTFISGTFGILCSKYQIHEGIMFVSFIILFILYCVIKTRITTKITSK